MHTVKDNMWARQCERLIMISDAVLSEVPTPCFEIYCATAWNQKYHALFLKDKMHHEILCSQQSSINSPT